MDPAAALLARETARHDVINETIARGDSPVQQFYAGAVVLVTGASGFLGKQLVEKLLRSCDLKKIFILLRTNKHGNAQERIKKLLDDPVYESLRVLQPNFEDKIEVVAGDVTLPRLGISDSDWSVVTEEVSVIFHGAATTSFTDPLKKTAITNVRGTREMILLAKQCKKLRAFVQISTAYSHAKLSNVNEEVLEQFHESPMAPKALIQLVEKTEEAALEAMTPQVIKGWPNSYSFTKAVAEELVRTMAADLPFCVVRPAIVICANREPVPGWIDKTAINSATGFVVNSSLGLLHLMYANGDIKLDLVPVDIVNNAAIAAAHETAERRARGLNDIEIYTITTDRNPLYFDQMNDIITKEGPKYATMKGVWYSVCFTISNRLLFSSLNIFFHSIPGYLVDALLLLVGRKPILTKVYERANKVNDVTGFYLNNTWKFGDSNLCEMFRRLTPADRVIYNCDIESVDWYQYIVLWVIGCRKYIIKDGLKDTEKAAKRLKFFKILHYIFVTLYAYLIYNGIRTSVAYLKLQLHRLFNIKPEYLKKLKLWENAIKV